MERRNIIKYKNLFGNNFLGPEELNLIYSKLGISKINEIEVPDVPFDIELLEKKKNTHILILFYPIEFNNSGLSLIKLINTIGFSNGKVSFYNQDWYHNEPFANKQYFENKWLLIGIDLLNESRGRMPENLYIRSENINLFSALQLAYTFFAIYFINKRILWKNDFIWTSDFDSNNDKIYVGRFFDPKGIANPGFSIHRHLKINENYGIL
jgi:hypothetical protein